jgi:TonB family protein
MPHALLLSPDDQAVSSITGVLEEMSVTYERPLDGLSAAQKLNSQSFDLVLVDCENLPAAKLIFDVCRRGKNGNNPVPIAIVDGRAGLPTAFRLGAELILTKPVAQDQARSTIRNAISRVKKDVPANEIPAQPADAAAPDSRARAAAASSQLTSFSEAAAFTTEMFAPVDEIKAAPSASKLSPRSATSPTLASTSSLFEKSLPETSTTRSSELSPKPALAFKPSDDPVLAELERTELESSQPKESALQSPVTDKAAPEAPAVHAGAPVFSSYSQGRPKARGSLVALLGLALAAAGFYAAWMYQPGFRAIAEPQIDRLLALVGVAQPPQTAAAVPEPSLAKPAGQLAPAATQAAAQASPSDPNQAPSAVTDSATGATVTSPTALSTNSTPTSNVATSPTQAATTPGPSVVPPPSASTTGAVQAGNKSEASKAGASGLSEKKDATAATTLSAPLPGESSTIILSSKGAEKRLAHSIPPKYPSNANLEDAQGTVVLKEVVDENGKVEGVRLVEGNVTLATAAIKAVKQWRYRPYLRDGRALPFQTVVILDFQRP